MSINVIDEKMTLINDEIREIMNGTSLLGLDDMKTELENANTQLVEQQSIITQLQDAIKGKVAGSNVTEEANDTGTTVIIW